jgi:hypothetical protein
MTQAAITVFAGPSLPRAVRPSGPFDWRPPAAAGDVLALLEQPPAKLCLIDGLFDSMPAPWHKELLLLMARGTLVFGAASMGALRAAELHRFGMIGIGAAFRAYRDARLHGDDEVALLHAGAELDWAPLSVPMIEMRATLAAACRARRLTAATARRVRDCVRDIHFSERDWPTMARACARAGLVGETDFARIEALHVPVKQQDARACLEAAAAAGPATGRAAPPPETCFIRRLAEERFGPGWAATG